MSAVIRCPVCGAAVAQPRGRGGRRRFCSTRCRRAEENDRRRLRRAALYASMPGALTWAAVYGPGGHDGPPDDDIGGPVAAADGRRYGAQDEETTIMTMTLVGIGRDDALALVERIVAHVPVDEPAGEPAIIACDVVLTADDERFAIEHDEHGAAFVTRTRAVGGGNAELTVFRDGAEISRDVRPVAL